LNHLSSFAELGVSAPVHQALSRRGIHAPFDIQTLVMRDALEGRDVLAKSRTGSGKTLAFAIPIAERLQAGSPRPSALVLVPTRELAIQVTEEMEDVARARGLRVAPVFGGVSIDAQARRAAKAHIIVATPGRMQDLLNRRALSVARISILILDEADRMLDMGFQPQVDGILAGLKGKHQTMFFSATLDGRVGKLARTYTENPVRHEVVEKTLAIEDATHRFFPVDDACKLDELVRLLNTNERDLALVFVRTKRGVDRLRKKLTARRVAADAMHGGMTQSARKRALDRFARGHVDVLIATDVAARGLDLDGITHVINFDPPNDHKDYVHRIGRTARAGRTGTGVTFVGTTQRHEMSLMARELKLSREFEADGLRLSAARGHRSAPSRSPGKRSHRRRSNFH
jgi:ATP-dependent RNA helicase RhlE